MVDPPNDPLSALENRLEAFESALQRGERPRLGDLLPEGPGRHAMLLELVHIELEHRLKAGEPARVEEYLRRYPELAGDRAAVLDLIRAECTLRCRREPSLVPVAEYAARFPAYAAEIQTLSDAPGAPPSQSAATVDLASPTASSLGSGPAPPPPLSVPQTLSVQGYEILGVLGRGGMGVVYKARHLKLNRLVALKMVLGGGHADPERLARFLAEAQAVARLQHANIVQIHEIGEQDGQPFFSLELVEGGSLDKKLAGAPLPVGAAAALVGILARAVHAAHQRGIVHRDLKPANVLLTLPTDEGLPAGGRPSWGTPKVTDFGLAKQLDTDSGQTRSGAVVGTPAYMAPEQASGHGKEVGPAADVYALGAILYECLTGRPPFRAATILETLELVCHREPVPPSRLQPGVPRDLETICLKCLQKEPDKRYAAAEALAEDLERFLDGRPIKARRAGLAERAWKWARRRPAVAGLAALALVVVVLCAAVLWIRGEAEQAQTFAEAEKRRTELTQTFNAGLDAPDWPVAHVEQLEGLLADLDRLDPGRGDRERPRLYRRYHDALIASFSPARKPVLEERDVPLIKAGVQALAARDAALALDVEQKLRDRLETLQAVLDLSAPFNPAAGAGPQDVFHGRKLRVTDKGLVLQPPARGEHDPLVLTSVSCADDVELEAAFAHPAWGAAPQLALVLRYQDGLTYTFVLAPSQAPAGVGGDKVKPLASFEEAYRARASLTLQIRRRGLLLRSRELPATSVWAAAAKEGALRLWAKSGGERLACRVNRLAPLEFDDVIGLGRKQGVFALHWPLNVPLESLHARRRTQPAAPSPLQRGDDAFARGQYDEALREYRQQAEISADPQVRQAARFKEGLCHLSARRTEEAAAAFQKLTEDDTPGRWKNFALCYLWALRLGQSDKAASDRLFTELIATGEFHALAQRLPEHVIDLLLARYRTSLSLSSGMLIYSQPNRIRDLQNAVRLEELLQTPPSRGRLTRFYLFRAYWMEGKVKEALPLARALIQEEPAQTPQNWSWWVQLREEYCLALRLHGQAARALQDLDGWLYVRPGTPHAERVPLLVERARIHAALGRWPQAEADLEEFFRRATPGTVHYRYWSQACLMLGLLRERHGDAAGAQQAWAGGLMTAHPEYRGRKRGQGAVGQLTQVILVSLTRNVPESDLRALIDDALDWLKGSFNPNKFNPIWILVQTELPPEVLTEVLREMWRTPHGRETARRIAFQERPLQELAHDTVVVAGVPLAGRLLRPAKLSADQEELILQMFAEGETALKKGQLSSIKLLGKLGLIWQGWAKRVKWEGTAAALPVPLRQQTAYVFGVRYLHHFRNPDQAAQFFRAAAAGVPANSLVHRLAREELERLKLK